MLGPEGASSPSPDRYYWGHQTVSSGKGDKRPPDWEEGRLLLAKESQQNLGVQIPSFSSAEVVSSVATCQIRLWALFSEIWIPCL